MKLRKTKLKRAVKDITKRKKEFLFIVFCSNDIYHHVLLVLKNSHRILGDIVIDLLLKAKQLIYFFF